MSYRVKDQMSPRIYPWWLILVGFVVGVFVTLVVTGVSRPTFAAGSNYPQDVDFSAMQENCDPATNVPTSQSIRQAETLDPLLVQATQMVIEATQTAQAVWQARCATIAQTTHSFDSGMAFPTDDTIFMTATAIVNEATLQAP